MTRSSRSNATYSGLQFTVSRYGTFDPMNEIRQQAFESEQERLKALGGDRELYEAEQKWQKHFGAAVLKPEDFKEYDLTPGSLNYISPTSKHGKHSGLASGMRFTRST